MSKSSLIFILAEFRTLLTTNTTGTYDMSAEGTLLVGFDGVVTGGDTWAANLH